LDAQPVPYSEFKFLLNGQERIQHNSCNQDEYAGKDDFYLERIMIMYQDASDQWYQDA
jgi:hypothetical protein